MNTDGGGGVIAREGALSFREVRVLCLCLRKYFLLYEISAFPVRSGSESCCAVFCRGDAKRLRLFGLVGTGPASGVRSDCLGKLAF